MRLKQWHFVSVVGDEWYLAACIAHLGYVGQASCFVVERMSREKYEFNRILPMARNIVFAQSSVRGTTTWREDTDYMSFEYQSQGGGIWSCSFNLPFPSNTRLKGQFSITPDESIALLYPLDSNRGAYTHKEAGNRAEGLVTFGMQELRFEHDACATMDWTRSFADRHTRWNWLSVAGISGDGRRIGINLSEHVYAGAENFVWLEGVPQPLGVVEFVKPAQSNGAWRIFNDKCELVFQPECDHRQQVKRPFVKSNLTQYFGMVDGVLRFGGGAMQINGFYGVCEEHDAIW